MINKIMNKVFSTCGLLFALAISISSCSVIKNYQQPEIKVSEDFRGAGSADTATIASIPWQELFTDTLLHDLINRSIANNPNRQVAHARIRQAQAVFLQSKAAFLPSLSSNIGYNASKLSESQGFGIRTSSTQYVLGVASAWEVDLWGKLRSSRNASLANLLQTEAGARMVQTNIVSSVATLYYTLSALDQQFEITRETVKNWDTTISVMQALKEASLVTEAAVVQSKAQRYAAEVTIPDIEQSIRETENALSILLGEDPQGINRLPLQNQLLPIPLVTGAPAQLLANRPDVQQAEAAYRNAFEMTNVARTAFYPTLSITGSAGFNSLSLSNFINPVSIAANIGAGLTQPIFNRRINKTNLLLAQEDQNIAFLNFKNALLVAGQEVSDALSLHNKALDKAAIRTNQLDALIKSVEYTEELLENGFANYNEVITARQSLLAAELGSINDRLQQHLAIINLYRALGGGWR